MKAFSHGFLYKSAVLLIALPLLAACSEASSPTPTSAPMSAPSRTPTLGATPIPIVEAPTLESFAESDTENVHYADVGDRSYDLDVHTPVEPGNWPTVVVVHGLGQKRVDLVRLAEAIASEGALVYNIDVNLTFPWVKAIEGIACAVRYARATADTYGGDSGRLILVGNSAGASTGSVAALAGDDFEGDCVVSEGSALPDALVGFEGPYNYATTVVKYDHTVLKEEDPELWEAINPYSHIGRNPDLQIRLVHGVDVDEYWYDIVPDVSEEFYVALADAGYDVELFLMEGTRHGALGFHPSEAFAFTVQQVMELARGSSQ